MENLSKKPVKGILKSSSSFEQADPIPNPKQPTDIKWDEMNILQTLHPADKDYGHIKIDEPKTPYSYASDGSEIDESSSSHLDPETLAAKVRESQARAESIEEDEEEEEDGDLTEEEKVKRKDFESKRKSHYNEFQAVKLARQLLEEEEDDDEGDRGTTDVDASTVAASSKE